MTGKALNWIIKDIWSIKNDRNYVWHIFLIVDLKGLFGWKALEKQKFFDVSRGVEKDQWYEMVNKYIAN